MARINIDDSIFTDPRFIDLTIRLGSLEAAIGALVMAWRLAQRWHLTPDRMIPVSEWEKHRIQNSIIEVGLAAREGEKIRVAGAAEQFRWLESRSRAGKASVEARKNAKRENIGEFGEQPLTPVEHPSTSSSFSFSNYKEKYVCAEQSSDAGGAGVISEFRENESVRSLLEARRVPMRAQLSWVAAYRDPVWIKQQILRAAAWEAENPKRAKKDFARFVGGWLRRGSEERPPRLGAPPHIRMVIEDIV